MAGGRRWPEGVTVCGRRALPPWLARPAGAPKAPRLVPDTRAAAAAARSIRISGMNLITPRCRGRRRATCPVIGKHTTTGEDTSKCHSTAPNVT